MHEVDNKCNSGESTLNMSVLCRFSLQGLVFIELDSIRSYNYELVQSLRSDQMRSIILLNMYPSGSEFSEKDFFQSRPPSHPAVATVDSQKVRAIPSHDVEIC